MFKRLVSGVVAAAIFIGLTGCATVSSGPSTQDTVYATHRMVKNLDQNLKGSVDKLNETTSNLSSRVEEYDKQIAQLRTVAQGNQSKLDNLQARLDELTTTLYRQLNLTPPAPQAPRVVTPAPAAVQPPAEVVPPATAPATPEPPAESTFVPPPPPPSAESALPAPVPAPAPTPETPAATPTAPAAQTAPAGNPVDEYKLARDKYIANDYAQALTLFDAFLTRYPTTELASSAQFWKAQCYFKLDKYTEAIQEFDAFRQKYPSETTRIPMAMHQEAVALANTGQVDKAKALFEKLIQEYPMDPAADGAKEKLKELQGH